MSVSVEADPSLLLQWAFGGLVVVFYATDRFKKPQPMRATTTFWRYWAAWCGYVVAMIGLFVLLGGAFTVVDVGALLQALGGATTFGEKLPGPLLSALLLTSLLPHFPVLGKIDAAVKEWFQRVGNIPFEVRELSSRLRSSTYDPPGPVLDQLLPVLGQFGVDPAWLRDAPDTIKQPWARSVALYAQFEQWEGARGYGRYYEDNKAVLGTLRAKVEVLSEMLDARVLTELDSTREPALGPPLRRKVVTDVGDLHRNLCDLVSGGVLNAARTYGQRYSVLTQMGFSGLPRTPAPMSPHDLVLVLGLVFLAVLFVPLMTRRFFDPMPLDQRARIVVMVPIIYGIAIILAIYPKSAWEFARRTLDQGRPVAAYALSGTIAAVAGFVVSLLFRFAFDAQGNVFQALASRDAFAQAWSTSLGRWPWLVMTFFATVAIAWAADDYFNSNNEPNWLRWAEGAVLACAFGAVQFAVLQYLPDLQGRTASIVVTATAVGAVIGCVIPHSHRRRGRGSRQDFPLGAVVGTSG